jgi:hypothetical protein
MWLKFRSLVGSTNDFFFFPLAKKVQPSTKDASSPYFRMSLPMERSAHANHIEGNKVLGDAQAILPVLY